MNVGRYEGEKVAVKIIPLDFMDSDNEIELQKLGIQVNPTPNFSQIEIYNKIEIYVQIA